MVSSVMVDGVMVVEAGVDSVGVSVGSVSDC
jgi:hypothetical protein